MSISTSSNQGRVLSNSWQALPKEIRESILSFLNNQDLVATGVVSKEWLKSVRGALSTYSTGRFNSRYIDTAFLKNLTIPVELVNYYLNYHYSQEDFYAMLQAVEVKSNLPAFKELSLVKPNVNVAVASISFAQLLDLILKLEAISFAQLLDLILKLEESKKNYQHINLSYQIRSVDGLKEYFESIKQASYSIQQASVDKAKPHIDYTIALQGVSYSFTKAIIDFAAKTAQPSSLLDEMILENEDKTTVKINKQQAQEFLKHLISLDLGSNNIEDDETKAIAEMLKTNKTLISLNLNENYIHDTGAHVIAEALKTNKTLISLNLSGNIIQNSGAEAIAEALKTNKTLISLNLSENIIQDDGTQAIAEMLKTNKTLISLNLRDNNIQDSGAKAIAEALKTNKTLTLLTLSGNNKISDSGAEILLKAAIAHENLKEVKIDKCGLSNDMVIKFLNIKEKNQSLPLPIASNKEQPSLGKFTTMVNNSSSLANQEMHHK